MAIKDERSCLLDRLISRLGYTKADGFKKIFNSLARLG